MFRARFGIWHDHVVLLMKDPLFGHFSLTLNEDDKTGYRELILETEGTCVTRKVAECNTYTYEMWPYYLLSANTERDGFCRCGPHEVFLHERQNFWHCEIPPNHRLPWPHLRDCKSYEKPEELMQECVMRAESARKFGERITPPPRHIQNHLTPEMRIKLFTVIK